MKALLSMLALVSASLSALGGAVGMFEGSSDIGTVGRPGSALFDAATQTYRVSGSGENMWFEKDACHFLWKRVSGDLTVAADIQWPERGGHAHRKACLVIRQSLDPNAAYADAAVHGDGLTSLQYRESAGAPTREIQAGATAPARVRLEKRGSYLSMSVAGADGRLRPAGGAFRLEFEEPFYVGLAVCAHDNAALETALFSKVEITKLEAVPEAKPRLASTLEVVSIRSKDRRVVYHDAGRFEAPNWSRDGRDLFFNRNGGIHRVSVGGGEPAVVDTAFARRCNNDHGLSPDGQQLVISDHSEESRSLIYLLPVAGGVPKRITQLGPSYWHGWSPDGSTLAFCGERQGEFDIYTIPVAGGAERRLTTAPGLDDGPDYSPDGAFIYFNSDRSGSMQIWRMRSDGTDQTAVTHDTFNNWFPHPSPDGKWLVFLSYEPDVKGHPENKDVTLRMMPLAGGEIQVVAKLFGGQGTINVPSWSPDSQRFAFVSYQFLADY